MIKTYHYAISRTTDFMSGKQAWLHVDANLSDLGWYVRSYVDIVLEAEYPPRFDVVLVTSEEIDLATVYERLNN